MKNILVAIVAATVLSLAASSPAAAQGAAIVKAPFKFIVGDQVLPAGTYRISPQTAAWTVVAISNIDGQSKAMTAFIATEGDEAQTISNDAHAKFVNYHGQYFLQEIAVPGRESRRVLITASSAERTLAKLNLSSAEPANATK